MSCFTVTKTDSGLIITSLLSIGLIQVDCQNLLSRSLMQIFSTTPVSLQNTRPHRYLSQGMEYFIFNNLYSAIKFTDKDYYYLNLYLSSEKRIKEFPQET